MSNKVKRELERIDIPEELHSRARMGVIQAKAEMEGENKMGEQPAKRKKNWSLGKKISYFGIAIVILFALFIGSAFVSPTMASVAAKVPFLNSIFETTPSGKAISSSAGMTIFKELKDEGYKVLGVGFTVRNKTMTIRIDGSEKYYNDVKDEVKSIAEDILQSKHYDAYNLKVIRYEEPVHMEQRSEESEKVKLANEAMQISLEIVEKLKQKNFNIIQSGVGYASPKSKEIQFQVSIPKNEKRVDMLKKIYHNVLKTEDIGAYTIKVHHVNMKIRAQEKRWMPVIQTIFDGLLAKKEYKVTGAGYSFHPLPLRIEIRTSVSSSDPHADELGRKIENTIRNFIESEEVEDNVKDDPYRIVVLSKDKKKIN